jgi:hypothetical protein
MHPDYFLTQLYLENPEIVYARTERLRLGLKNPPLGINEYWSILKERQLEKFVQALEKNFILSTEAATDQKEECKL